jgi:hypothetical protein
MIAPAHSARERPARGRMPARLLLLASFASTRLFGTWRSTVAQAFWGLGNMRPLEIILAAVWYPTPSSCPRFGVPLELVAEQDGRRPLGANDDGGPRGAEEQVARLVVFRLDDPAVFPP